MVYLFVDPLIFLVGLHLICRTTNQTFATTLVATQYFQNYSYSYKPLINAMKSLSSPITSSASVSTFALNNPDLVGR